MSEPHPHDPARRPGATAAQIKDDIDSGRTGDKVAGFDPAASPLGTDEEAGGTPHDPALMAQARLSERAGRPTSREPNAATPELQPDARLRKSPVAVPILVGAGVALALAAGIALLL